MSGKDKKGGFLDKIGLGKSRPVSQVQSHPRPLSTDIPDCESDHGSAAAQLMSGSPNPGVAALPDKEVETLFLKMLDDMNLTDEKKMPLLARSIDEKRKLLTLQKKGTSQTGSKLVSASDFINALNDHSGEKLCSVLGTLRVSLTNNTVSWAEEFGEIGLNNLLLVLNNCYHKRESRDPRIEKIQHECIKCLRAFMNNKPGLKKVCSNKKVIQALCRSLDYKSPPIMMEAIKLLAAVCFVPPDGYEKVLQAISEVNGDRDISDRFKPIVKGLGVKKNEPLIASCLQLINALLSSPDDLDFRLHLRNEFMRAGLIDFFKELKKGFLKFESGEVGIQIEIFRRHKDEDYDEFSQRYDNIRLELDDVNDCYELLKNSVMESTSEPYFLSILQHLLCIREDPIVRVAYYQLIEECVSQIVLQRSGCDPDFRPSKKIEIDVEPLIGNLVERVKEDGDGKSVKDLNRKLEEFIVTKQEYEARISQLEGKLQQYESGTIKPIPGKVGGGPPPPPPPPPPPGGFMGGGGPPPPPPMPGMGGPPPPPPPPPMPGMGGPPPPPPMPGMGGPPPPPMPGGGGPPPPPGMPAMAAGPPPLPHGLKMKKKYTVEAPLKKANWKKINPQTLSKDAFWVNVREEEMPCDDLLKELSSKFCTKPVGKPVGDGGTAAPEKKLGKKTKELKFLDAKKAQNLAILLGSLKMSHQDMKRGILRCDEQCIPSIAVDQLIDLLPEQLNQWDTYKDQMDELSDAEQFIVTISSIKRLLPRLKSFKFKIRFDEMLQDIKPDIVSGTEACTEVRSSKKFAKMLEVILLIGNYMNSGSSNAQSFGFELNFITKLAGTKAVDNKTTLLHFLALMTESKFPDLLSFGDELVHSDKAAKVSAETLQKLLADMGKSVKQLELDLENHKAPQSEDDKFIDVMSSFAKDARSKYDLMDKMLKNMESSYQNLAEYFTFDPKKYLLDEFFSDISSFKNAFKDAVADNRKLRETEEKIQRAKEAREKAERDKQKRQANKNALINMDGDDNQVGVMDNLLEALNTGKAFGCMDKQRKRAPRATGAARQAQLNRSRSRSGLTMPMSPAPGDALGDLLMNSKDEFGGAPAKPRRMHQVTGNGRTVMEEGGGRELNPFQGSANGSAPDRMNMS